MIVVYNLPITHGIISTTGISNDVASRYCTSVVPY
jgi:hypothetical protein